MYQNFEGLEQGEDIKIFKIFLVSPHPKGILNQKKLVANIDLPVWTFTTMIWDTLIQGGVT